MSLLLSTLESIKFEFLATIWLTGYTSTAIKMAKTPVQVLTSKSGSVSIQTGGFWLSVASHWLCGKAVREEVNPHPSGRKSHRTLQQPAASWPLRVMFCGKQQDRTTPSQSPVGCPRASGDHCLLSTCFFYTFVKTRTWPEHRPLFKAGQQILCLSLSHTHSHTHHTQSFK